MGLAKDYHDAMKPVLFNAENEACFATPTTQLDANQNYKNSLFTVYLDAQLSLDSVLLLVVRFAQNFVGPNLIGLNITMRMYGMPWLGRISHK